MNRQHGVEIMITWINKLNRWILECDGPITLSKEWSEKITAKVTEDLLKKQKP